MMEWKEYSLHEIASFSQGKQVPVGDQFEKELVELDRFIRIVDFTSDWTQSPRFVKKDDKYKVDKNDIVMLRYGTPGKVFRGHEGIIANNMFKISPDESIVSKEYLYWFLFQDSVYKILMANQSSSTMPAISFKMLSCVNVKIPSFETQKHISSFFDSIDAKITVNKKICENLEAQAQALFKHWFVDFAPFKDGKFVESELGMIPEGWRVGRLEEMASVVGSGGTPKSSVKEYYIGDILWYGTGEFNDSFIYDSEKHISQEAIDNSSAKIFPIHTVLIAMYGATVGKLAILSNEASFNQAALGIVAADNIGFPFIYLTLLACRKQLIRLACGAAQQNLNAGTIKSHLTIIPNDNTMMSFNDLILPIFEKVECLQKESHRLTTLRDTLLPKLMSGEIKI